jgi:aminopeptidase N
MPSLTHAEAIRRASSVTVESYDIELDLTCGDRTFRSVTSIRFSCAEPGIDTFLEVKPATLRAATLNGVPLDLHSYGAGRLPLRRLAAQNVLVVDADMAYTNSGTGLHRFVDPADGSTYLYAQSFLDDAPRWFACFDQPDLKAPVTLRVRADPSWVVAANGAETRLAGGHWRFATTKPLATYFVTLIAGPYHVVRSEHDGVPLAIYARAALRPHLEAQAPEMFDITRACLDHYHHLFGVRFPFGKYDQAFVPEFTMGAMENPGCVTFRDDLIFTSAATEDEYENRAGIIAHEMAHMWFGDLVTMRWWDDLWLNESFADYLGTRTTADATHYREAWTSFALGRKAWGYAADQRPSTHPVAGTVHDTDQALVNFDGISYAKGASVLKQLAAVIGDDAFLAGLRTHFARHAYANATLADLLDALGESSGRDLSEWAELWLRTSGVNTLRARRDGSRLVIDQTAAPYHRPHRIEVASYTVADDGVVDRASGVNLEVAGATTGVPGLVPGDLVLVNDRDLSYAKVRLDPAGRDSLRRVLPALDDSLTRALLWGTAWDATRDAEMDAREFLDLCAIGLPRERHVGLFAEVLEYARDFAADRYLPPWRRDQGLRLLASACHQAMAAAPPGSSLQLAAARGRISCAGPDDVPWLSGWLADPAAAPEALRIDADLRWLLLTQLAVLGVAGADDIDAEYARDHTASGAERAARARAARPDPDAKAWAWHALIHDQSLSNRILFSIASGFWRPGQEQVTASYVDRFVADMPAMARWRDAQVAETIGQRVFPAFAIDATTLATMRRMNEDESLAVGFRRSLIDQTDELARSLAARALATTEQAFSRTPED